MLAGERGDDGVDRLLNFRVGQRAIQRPERETKRQADLPIRHALALIAIELTHTRERGRRIGSNRATKMFGWQAFINQDCEVTDDRWMPRQGRDGGASARAAACEHVEI